MTASLVARCLGVVLTGALTLGTLGACTSDEPEAIPIPTPSPSPAPEPAATTFTVGGKGYSITFPAKPVHTREEAKRGLKLTTDVFTLRTEDANYSLSRVSYAGHDAPSLRSALSSAAGQTGGRLTSSRAYTYRGQPAVEGTIVGSLKSDREAQVTIRYFLVDDRILIGLIYVPNVKPTKATKRARDAFLDSLRFQTPPKSAVASTEGAGASGSGDPLPG